MHGATWLRASTGTSRPSCALEVLQTSSFDRSIEFSRALDTTKTDWIASAASSATRHHPVISYICLDRSIELSRTLNTTKPTGLQALQAQDRITLSSPTYSSTDQLRIHKFLTPPNPTGLQALQAQDRTTLSFPPYSSTDQLRIHTSSSKLPTERTALHQYGRKPCREPQ